MFSEYDSDPEDFTGGAEETIVAASKKKDTAESSSRKGYKKVLDTSSSSDKDADAEKASDIMDDSAEAIEGYIGTVGIKSEYAAIYQKVIKIRDPAENMTINKLSRFDYANLISIETKRIESEDYPFINPGKLDSADLIAESTIAQRKCPYNLLRYVGYEIDHANSRIIEIYEDFNPNEMMHPKLNATKML